MKKNQRVQKELSKRLEKLFNDNAYVGSANT